MKNTSRSGALRVALLSSLLAVAPAVHALDFGTIAKDAVKDGAKAAGHAARDKILKDVNTKLLVDARKNQCSFKTDSDELAPGCDVKVKRLTSALVEVKKRLKGAGIAEFKFEVSGHTDSSGTDEHNKTLSGKRAAVIVKELVARGIPPSEIESVAVGADRLLVKPDNTPAKKAKNRRYEIRVKA
jgi:OOP family OmpA-OmpF porin